MNSILQKITVLPVNLTDPGKSNAFIWDKNAEFAWMLKFVQMHKSFGGIEQRWMPADHPKRLVILMQAD